MESELDFENGIANGYKLACTNEKKTLIWDLTGQAIFH